MLIPGDSRPPEIEWWPTMLRNTYTRGATAPVTAMGRLNNVSIHAPTRGATFRRPRSACQRRSFNPRTHTGCDMTGLLQEASCVRFQSTHPHGVRHMMKRQSRSLSMFQSTHPHGVRHFFVIKIHIKPSGFNPRTHTGCDGVPFVATSLPWVVSIHAPTRGATSTTVYRTYEILFQSTHPHGVRPARWTVFC